MNTNAFIYQQSFHSWIWTANKQTLWQATTISLIAFVLFKVIYPYPEFSVESELYIQAAVSKALVHVYPIGYSVFLRLVGCLSHSHLLLIFIQYLLLQMATLWLVFTVCYLLKLEHLSRSFAFTSLVFTPLYLYVANFVTSAAIFAAFSMAWIASLLWLFYKPGKTVLYTHSILLTLLLALHNSAIYFPFISVVVMILRNEKWLMILFVVLLPATFVSFTQYQYGKRTGITTYSPLVGWELAGNALTAYTQVPAAQRVQEDVTYRLLEETNNRFIDSMQQATPLAGIMLRQYFVWSQNSPLYTFMLLGRPSDPFKYWTQYGKFYNEYALLLIKRYPRVYLQHFVGPNLKDYYVPRISLPAMYNIVLTGGRKDFFTWFNVKESDVVFHHSLDRLAGYYTVLFAMSNLLFVLGVFAVGFNRNMHDEWNVIQKGFGLITGILIANFLFNVFTTPVEIGYLVAHMVTMVIFSTLAVHMLARRSTKQEMIAINYDK